MAVAAVTTNEEESEKRDEGEETENDWTTLSTIFTSHFAMRSNPIPRLQYTSLAAHLCTSQSSCHKRQRTCETKLSHRGVPTLYRCQADRKRSTYQVSCPRKLVPSTG